MKMKQFIPYNLKRLLPILGLAGASLFTSCNKEDDIIPYKEVDVLFFPNSLDVLCSKDNKGTIQINPTIKYHVADPATKTIYLVPDVLWDGYDAEDITRLRKEVLEPVINYSPKIRGKGIFEFGYQEACKVPEDSLWIVQQGWKIDRVTNQNRKER